MISTRTWEINVFVDFDCPLCSREIRLLDWLDRGRGRIAFEDISAPEFDPGRYGLDLQQVMDRIHAQLPDGSIIEGVEVFRLAYRAVGLGWLMAPTRWPGFRQLCDAAYRVFARNRLRWTGRACPIGQAGSTPYLTTRTSTDPDR